MPNQKIEDIENYQSYQVSYTVILSVCSDLQFLVVVIL